MRKSVSTLVAAVGAAGILAGASAVQAASDVQFDVTGSGSNWQTISYIDMNAGNALSVGGQSAAVGDSFDVYFQSNVSQVQLSGGGQVAGIGSTYYLTVITKFSESKSYEIPGLAAGFQEGNGGNEYFQVWLSSTPGGNLAGTNFGSDDASAVLLLAGNNVNVTGGGFNISQKNGQPLVAPLDGTGDGNQYPGITSVVGNGSTTVAANINYVNSNYFKGILSGEVISLILANPASAATPFDAVNPSQQFWDALTSSYVTPNIGSINGVTGPDFQFQTNGNLTFEVTQLPVPEPATAVMGLFGLAGLALAARRRRMA